MIKHHENDPNTNEFDFYTVAPDTFIVHRAAIQTALKETNGDIIGATRLLRKQFIYLSLRAAYELVDRVYQNKDELYKE